MWKISPVLLPFCQILELLFCGSNGDTSLCIGQFYLSYLLTHVFPKYSTQHIFCGSETSQWAQLGAWFLACASIEHCYSSIELGGFQLFPKIIVFCRTCKVSSMSHKPRVGFHWCHCFSNPLPFLQKATPSHQSKETAFLLNTDWAIMNR